MGKLHELLAVEADLKAQAQQALAKVKNLFQDGTGKLVGQVRTYEPLFEGGEPHSPEITVLATTIANELDALRGPLVAWINAAVTKEVTNQKTSAHIVLDGDGDFDAENLPAKALLNLESKLAELRQVIVAIPTNDPSETWGFDTQLEHYVSAPRVTYRTKKVPKAVVMYEATKEHPAQVQAFTEDERV